MKGIGKGIGKGLIGLIFKPVAGTIDVVTCTARGVETLGGRVYSNLFKIKKKAPLNINLDNDLINNDH